VPGGKSGISAGVPDGLSANRELWVAVQFESSDLTIAMEAWKPASLRAMPPQSNIM